jgi:hypothetical protein
MRIFLPDIKLFVDAVAAVSCQPSDKRHDMVRAAGDAAEAFVTGHNAAGLPKLKEFFGEAVAKKCADWLNYRAEARGAAGERAATARGSDDFGRGAAGQILKNHPGNIALAIKLLGVHLQQNEFSVQPEIEGLPGFGPNLDDAGAAQLRVLIHEKFGFLPTKEIYEDLLTVEAHKRRVHPIREYLTGLNWDGQKRVKNWLSEYLGTEETIYVKFVGKCFFVALVARILKPGCKQDYMLILEGSQGTLKSAACATIAGEWFSDSLPDLREGKDVSQHLQGKWLIEIGELSAMNKAEANSMKHFITRQTERYRPSYGRRDVIQPRQCIFIGTTNDQSYLRDPTGGRRFWPVKTGEIKVEALARGRDQLLAEAVALFRAGAKWWPDRAFEAEHIKPEQDARYAADPWLGPITDYLDGKERVTVWQIACNPLGMLAGRVGTHDSRRIIEVLISLGWVQKRSHGKGWYVRRGD